MRQPKKSSRNAGTKTDQKASKKVGKPAIQRRQYDSPLRRQQTAETRDRIVAAGAEIAHRLPAWEWSEMTFKAVGARAGVSERTVHRYFATERILRDAVVQRLVQESGISLEALKLGDFAGVAVNVYRYLSTFKVALQTTTDPTFAALDLERRQALLDAVARSAPGWSASEQEIAAAMLDMLWNPFFFERLTTSWQLDVDRASQAISWIIGLVETAIQKGQRPKGKG
jgi:AcrR family transcriptional regulator